MALCLTCQDASQTPYMPIILLSGNPWQVLALPLSEPRLTSTTSENNIPWCHTWFPSNLKHPYRQASRTNHQKASHNEKSCSNLLTPTWPLCKNILYVDNERSISFRKCNRWKSFDIVHVCLNNKIRLRCWTVTAWSRCERALLAIRKTRVRASTDFVYNYYIGKIKSTMGQVAR